MKTRLAAAALLLMTVPAVRADMEPVGPEFQVNTYTPYEQRDPAIAGDASGRFVVTGRADLLRGRSGRLARGHLRAALRRRGRPAGPSSRQHLYDRPQDYPAVGDAAGRFIVGWSSGYFRRSPRAGRLRVRSVRAALRAAGTRLGAEFR